jgi:hypothetical protein
LLPYFDLVLQLIIPKFTIDKRDRSGDGGALIVLRKMGWIALYLFMTVWYAFHTVHAVTDARSVCKREHYKEVKIKEKEEIMMISKKDIQFAAATPENQDTPPQCYFYI